MSLKLKFLSLKILLSILISVIVIFIINDKKELLRENFKLKEMNLFYRLSIKTEHFLNTILNIYHLKEKEVIQKHYQALNYFKTHSLDSNLSFLHSKLKTHIFITDDNLTIKNTTFKYDKGFSLKFVKEFFESHRGKVFFSPPICEPATAEFISFSDSFIPLHQNSKKVLQLGVIYNQKEVLKIKNEIKSILKKYNFIKNVEIYFIQPKLNFAQKCNILKPLGRKFSLQEMINDKKKGLKLFKKLQKNNPLILKKENNIKEMYMLQKGVFLKDSFVIYKITFDETEIIKQEKEYKKLLNIVFLLLIIFILIEFYIVIKLIIQPIINIEKRVKEKQKIDNKNILKRDDEIGVLAKSHNKSLDEIYSLIEEKTKLLNFVAHELKTPLSNISLNNDLRDKIKGEDKYSERIKLSIKTLKNSYDDIVYYLKLEKNSYEKEKINFNKILKDRISFFETIAKNEKKNIKLTIKDEFEVFMNKSELERLIDNNLTNSIKYSSDENIEIVVENRKVTFINSGNLKDKKKIFEEFYREDTIKGGFGIGLAIIKEICKKYKIEIKVENKNNRVKFIYNFKGQK